MKTRFYTASFVVAALLLVAAPVLRAQDGVQGALEQVNRAASLGQRLSPLSGPALAIADLDKDNKPDGAVLLEATPCFGTGRFQVDLHFTDRDNARITFQSSESNLAVVALDIDHDGDIDLVIEQSLTHKGLQVWLNDGHGNFEKGRIEDFPSADVPSRELVRSSERLEPPAASLPTQRGFETMLMACHVAGRPPSEREFADVSTNLSQIDHPFSLTASRAPPLS